MGDHEEGLIGQYVSEIQALGIRAEAGENVQAAVEAAVAKACDHFRVVKTSDPQANLIAFKSKLKLTGERAYSSQPGYKRTLEHAASVCPSEI